MNIKHPAIFVVLVVADVVENAYCLYSLRRVTSREKKGGPKQSTVVPLQHLNETEATNEPPTKCSGPQKKSLVKRTSTVYAAMRDLKAMAADRPAGDAQYGTALFIVATLLQRELVETLVPLQALVVTSIFYASGTKWNALVSGWTDANFHQAIMYIGIDLGVELIVFVSTIVALGRIFPKIRPSNVILGLVWKHIVPFTMMLVVSWFGNMLYQCTYSGMDLSFDFSWLR